MNKIGASFNKLKNTLEEQLKKGTSPSKLSLAITLGFIWGIIPFPGVNTAICLLLAWQLKLNVAVIQLINYAAFPLQILLFIPFIKVSTFVSGYSVNLPLDSLWIVINNHPAIILNEVFTLLLQGVIAWFIASIPLFLICFYLIKQLLSKRISASKNSGSSV